MMGLLHGCLYNAIAGINSNLSSSFEHDMQVAEVARSPAVRWSNVDSNLWIYLTQQTMVSVPEAKMHRKVIVFQFIAEIKCEWQL